MKWILIAGCVIALLISLARYRQVKSDLRTKSAALEDSSREVRRLRSAARNSEGHLEQRVSGSAGTGVEPLSAGSLGSIPTKLSLSEVQNRIASARSLVSSRDFESALEAYKTLLGEIRSSDMPRAELNTSITQVLSAIWLLVRQAGFQPAREFAVQIRDEFESGMRASATMDRTLLQGMIMNYAMMNAWLEQDSRIGSFFDELPEDNPAKERLAPHAYSALIAGGRYEEALKARPLGSLLSEIDNLSRSVASVPQGASERVKGTVIKNAADGIEALVATGRVSLAATLASQLNASPAGGEASRHAIATRLQRIGREELSATLLGTTQ